MMQANWSLIINILLLIGVFIAIGRMMKMRNNHSRASTYQPPKEAVDSSAPDDIIAVRKISGEQGEENSLPKISAVEQKKTNHQEATDSKPKTQSSVEPNADSVMIFLRARDNQQLAGYELLQTVLAAGLRFGEGHLFHRHQHANGQGPVLCSLAAATNSGVFDLQNIGAFSVRGLCLFMHASGNPVIDGDRFKVMLDTARQLSQELDTLLLDDKQRPLTDACLVRYYERLNLTTKEVQSDPEAACK